MKKIIKSILALLLAAGVLTGCQEKSIAGTGAYDNLVFIGGQLSNEPDYNYEDIAEFVSEATKNGGSALLINPDGQPHDNVASYDIKALTPNRTRNYNEQEALSYATDIIKKIKKLEAKVPESSIFESFEIMNNFFCNNWDQKNVAVICHNGITTKVPVDLSQYTDVNQLKGQSQKMIDDLRNQGLVFDLHGLTVYWFGFGDVNVKNQQPLTTEAVDALKQLYIDYFNACNATVVFQAITSKENQYNELPSISKVNIKEYQQIDLSKYDFSYDESKVRFVVGTDQFVDEAEATNAIEGLVNAYKEHPVKLFIAGCSNEPDGITELSQKRADRIASLLVSKGVASTDIKAKGLGRSNEWFNPDNEAANRRIEAMAYDKAIERGLA